MRAGGECVAVTDSKVISGTSDGGYTALQSPSCLSDEALMRQVSQPFAGDREQAAEFSACRQALRHHIIFSPHRGLQRKQRCQPSQRCYPRALPIKLRPTSVMAFRPPIPERQFMDLQQRRGQMKPLLTTPLLSTFTVCHFSICAPTCTVFRVVIELAKEDYRRKANLPKFAQAP